MRKHFLPSPAWLCAASLFALAAAPAHGDERIYFNGTVNGKAVRLSLDTGSSESMLMRETATRLGLKIIPRPKKTGANSKGLPMDSTEQCLFALGRDPLKFTFRVLDWPGFAAAADDGILSWNNINLGDDVLVINGAELTASIVPLPPDVSAWTKWKIVPSLGVLVFERKDGNKTVRLGIDTGSDEGVGLNTALWKKWRADHPLQPETLQTYWEPLVGLVVSGIRHVAKIDMDGIVLEDIPVSVESSADADSFQKCDAVLGLFALAQTKLIIDKKNGVVYTAPYPNPARMYDYNRLGAFFVAKNPQMDYALAARVMKGSPAEEAGVRDGDILISADSNFMVKPRNGMNIGQLGSLTRQPPGTQLELVIRHGDDIRRVTATLKEPEDSGWSATDMGTAWQRGKAAVDNEDYDNAIPILTEAIQQDAGNAGAWFFRSIAREKKHDNANALADIEEAMRLHYVNTYLCFFNRAVIHEKLGDHDKALADYNEAARLNPDDADIFYSRAVVYDGMGEMDKTLADYSEAIRINSDYAMAYYGRSLVYQNRDEMDKALADVQKAIQLDPKYADAIEERGNILYDLGEDTRALADYNAAMGLAPDDGDDMQNCAYVLATCPDASLRDGKRAVDYAARAGATDEWKDPNDLVVMGAAFAEAGNFDQAVKCETKYLVIQEKDNSSAGASYSRRRLGLYRAGKAFHAPQTYYIDKKGTDALDRGDYDSAIASFDEEIHADPEVADAFFDRGLAYDGKGDLDKAIASYTEAIRLDPGYTDILVSRGADYFKNKQDDKAAADCDKAIAGYDAAIRSDPANPKVYNHAAWKLATISTRDAKKSLEYVTEACVLTQWKDVGDLDTFAAACAAAGDFKQAAQWETTCINTPGISPEQATAFKSRLALYEQGKPYLEVAKR